MGTFRFKSDLRNHQAIVQPRLCDCMMVTRLYDCLMVTQITLKTEGPHGLPSGRLPAEVDPPDGEVLLHLNRLRLRSTLITLRREPCANAGLVREASGVATLSSGPPHLAKDYETFS